MSTIDFAILDNYDENYDYSEIADNFSDWEDLLVELNAVSIDDDSFYYLNKKLKDVPTLTCEHKQWLGIAEYGITIIPPKSLDLCLKRTQKLSSPVFVSIIELFERAKCDNKYIICFG